MAVGKPKEVMAMATDAADNRERMYVAAAAAATDPTALTTAQLLLQIAVAGIFFGILVAAIGFVVRQ